MIWDDHQGRCIGELGFRSQVRLTTILLCLNSMLELSSRPTCYSPTCLQVRAVKLRRDKIAVALEQKVLVYDFADLKLLHNIEALSNPNGLLALSAAAENTVLACPGLNLGQV